MPMRIDWEHSELEVIWMTLWVALESAATSPGHPWRTPVLATAGDEGGARVVVLRDANRVERCLKFQTDIRSPKVAALRRSPWVTWVFYSPEWQVQLRMRAQAVVHFSDTVTATQWERVPPSARANYSSDSPPGEPRANPFSGEYLESTGESHFAVVETTTQTVDWLWLRPGAHRRAGWRWEGQGWQADWRTP